MCTTCVPAIWGIQKRASCLLELQSEVQVHRVLQHGHLSSPWVGLFYLLSLQVLTEKNIILKCMEGSDEASFPFRGAPPQ